MKPPAQPNSVAVDREVIERALDQLPGIVWTTDRELVVTSARGAVMATLGHRQNETVGMSLFEYLNTSDASFPVIAAHRRALGGEHVTMEHHWRARDLEIWIQPLRGENEEIIGVLGLLRDITERKRAERLLPQHVEQLRSGAERPPDYLAEIDATGRILATQGFRGGVQTERLVGERVQRWIRPENLPLVETTLRKTFVQGESQQLEIPAIGEDGADCWYDVRVRPVAEEGQVQRALVVVHDITDRKRAEMGVREQAELLRQVLAHVPHAVFWKDRHCVYLGCNERFAHYVGVARTQDVVGRTDEELAKNAEDLAWLKEGDVGVLRSGEPLPTVERTIRWPDGHEITALMSKVPLRDASGAIVGLLGSLADVSELRRADEALRASEERFRLLAENLPGVVYLCRNDERYSMVYLNEAVTQLTGYTTEEFLTDRVSFVDLYHPEDAPQIRPAVEAALRDRQPYRLVYRLRRKDGDWRWIQEIGVGIFRGRELVLLEGFLSDVTDQKIAELRIREVQEELERRVANRTAELTMANLRLRESERTLQSILDNSTAIVYVKDLEGRYLLVNSQFCRIFHLSAEEILGKTDYDVFPAEISDRFRDNDREVLKARTALEFDEVAIQDGAIHHYISQKFPLFDVDGSPSAICGISTDITDRKHAEQKLRSDEQFLRKLLELRERERKLVAYEIHDGMLQDIVAAKMILEGLYRDGTQVEPQRHIAVGRLLDKALTEGRRMISELRPLILDEQGIVASIEYLIAEHQQQSGLHVAFKHRVSFDRLSPLLENALFRIAQEALNNVRRHSQTSEAEVRLTQVDDQIRLEIRDAGVGFDPASVSADRFGLRGIVERTRLFDGAAVIESRPGGGTRVVVEVPLEDADPPAGIEHDVEGQGSTPKRPL